MHLTKAWLGAAPPAMLHAFEREVTALAEGTTVLRNPLLLTWAVAAYTQFGELRLDEIDLHEAVFDMTIGQRDWYRAVTRADALTAQTLTQLAVYLAWWLKSSEQRLVGVPEREALQEAADWLGTTKPYSDPDPTYRTDAARRALNELVERTGLIYQSGADESGERLLSAVQDSFGEYLVARHLLGRFSDPADLALHIVPIVAVGRFGSGWRYCVQLWSQRSSSAEQLLDALDRTAAEYYGPGREHVMQMHRALRETVK
jgi:hypothetical protein